MKRKYIKGKNFKTRSTVSVSGKNKKGKGRDSDKSTKYQSDHKSGGHIRGKGTPRERDNASKGGRTNIVRSPPRDSSQRNERTLQK